ncbi:MAG: sensor histidine kinase [Pseudomonadota bacterium]|nr:sensor histidine kinase [Pseudomonadota bacterium]
MTGRRKNSPETHNEKREPASHPRTGERRRRHGRLVSPLTRRILTVNMVALGMLVGGLLYLGQYEDGLIEAELDALRTQGEIFAGALGQGAVGTGADGSQSLLPEVSRQLLRRLTEPTRTRARLYDSNGDLVADSRFLKGQGGSVEVEDLPPPETESGIRRFVEIAYEALVVLLPARGDPSPYFERANQTAFDYPEVTKVLSGETGRNVRLTSDKAKVLIAALPVQRFKQVLGALMLTTGGAEIELAVRDVRFGILKVFAVALAVTVLLSFYLAGTIARPVRRLAEAADQMHRGQGGRAAIPDFTRRRDEIGDLSGALRDMTDALWHRMEEIENFAADVAHEIKNPLTSLRSAVETAARVSDPNQQRQLMSIIQEDVKRMDRLISDISSASRLDAELARTEFAPVDIGELLDALVQVENSKCKEGEPGLTNDPVDSGSCVINGIEGRLVQVFQNLVGNALSFSPPEGNVHLSAKRDNGDILIFVEDSGPGIPPENLNSVFERFYSQRPDAEAFGTHSGLGLSISRQIIEAHDGAIIATNRYGSGDEDSAIIGARFEIRLPES